MAKRGWVFFMVPSYQMAIGLLQPTKAAINELRLRFQAKTERAIHLAKCTPRFRRA
jgi:hypothetical protein